MLKHKHWRRIWFQSNKRNRSEDHLWWKKTVISGGFCTIRCTTYWRAPVGWQCYQWPKVLWTRHLCGRLIRILLKSTYDLRRLTKVNEDKHSQLGDPVSDQWWWSISNIYHLSEALHGPMDLLGISHFVPWGKYAIPRHKMAKGSH